MAPQWWQRAVFYQIYPRSFADSNGDGIGDLDGITERLDYLNDATPGSLGIDAIWLGPINPSPLKDFGYDVSDYYAVHPHLGALKNFDRLIAEAHRRNIRVILDLVPNHTSDQHPWFIESRSSASSERRGWYVWRPGAPDRPPNNWASAFGGAAWTYDARSAQWYLHSFFKEQPDLDYRNPRVTEEMCRVIGYWAERGADGFRVDAIANVGKDPQLRDNPPRTDDDPATRRDPAGAQIHEYDQDRPLVHDVVRAFRRAIDRHPGRMMVGEVWPRHQAALADYLRPDEFHLAFNFAFFRCKWGAGAFRGAVAETERLLTPGAWPTYTLSNHDFSRHLTRYRHGGDPAARARVAAMMMLTLRGTPFLYYGEEIGMTDVEIPPQERRDPVGRDRCRTPMQWTRSGGFSRNPKTWLPMGDCAAVNAESQLDDPNSLLSFYRRLIWMRKRTPALLEGGYRVARDAPEECLVFTRELKAERILVALNFGPGEREIRVPDGQIMMSTSARSGAIAGTLRLRADEGAIVELAPRTQAGSRGERRLSR